jgi:hypothetical protein
LIEIVGNKLGLKVLISDEVEWKFLGGRIELMKQ